MAEAHDYAADSHCGPWQYAVEIDSLLAGGVTAIDLHWLVKSGYAEHAREVTRLSDEERIFRAPRGASFTKRTCFVVTGKGAGLTTSESVLPSLRRAA